jgi:ribonuclease III family protein
MQKLRPRVSLVATILNSSSVSQIGLASPTLQALAPQTLALQLAAPQLSPQELQQLNPISLAFLGDAVYELIMRQRYLLPPKRINDYHKKVVAQVRAEQQALQLTTIEPHLTPDELDLVRRGRNAAPKSRRADPGVYQRATGFEVLIGYLYLTDIQRLELLLSYLELGDLN